MSILATLGTGDLVEVPEAVSPSESESSPSRPDISDWIRLPARGGTHSDKDTILKLGTVPKDEQAQTGDFSAI